MEVSDDLQQKKVAEAKDVSKSDDDEFLENEKDLPQPDGSSFGGHF